MATSVGTEIRHPRRSGATDRTRVFSPLARPVATAPLKWRRGAAYASAALLFLSDAISFAIAVASAIVARHALEHGSLAYPWGMLHPWNLWSAGVLWVMLRTTVGLYRGHGIAPPEELRRNVTSTLLAAAAHAIMLFAFQAKPASRLLALGTWMVIVPVSVFVRELVRGFLIRHSWYGRPVVIAGAGKTGALVVRELRATPEMGLIPVALFDDDPMKHGTFVDGVPVLGSITEAGYFPRMHRIDQVIVALPSTKNATAARLVQGLSERFRSVTIIPGMTGLSCLNTRTRPLGMFAGIEIGDIGRDWKQRALKRGFDLTVGIPIFLVSVPVLVVLWAMVRISSAGPGFYAQEREGFGGKKMRIWKLRTMVVDAEARLAHHLATDPAAREEWERTMKLRDDPRIIPLIGKFLRRSSLDELPQVWNVLVGNMSLVGPRPFPEYHLTRFPSEFRKLRRRVVPGMTGLWQVSNRSDGDLTVQEAADSFYVHNRSFWLDLWILFRTFRVVVEGTGAY